MAALFLILVLAQGVPATSEGGHVTGVLRAENGAPAAGVRVAATSASANVAGAGATLISLSETDNEGRFVLENVPPGRYYIMAGRIDQPTFFPGTLEVAKGSVLTIRAGDRLSNIDFVIAAASYRPVPERRVENKPLVMIPITVAVDGGGTLPVSAGVPPPMIQLVPIAGGANLEVPLNSAGIAIPVSGVTEEYRVRVENLPEGYRVKSITFGSTDLVSDTLKASLREIPLVPAPRVVTFTGEGELQRIIDEIVRRRSGPKTLAITLATK